MSYHDLYYQTGGGGRGVSNVFVGNPRMRGHGLGSWFSGIFRTALPFLAKGARAIGKEALRAGVNILEDIGENNMNFKESFKNPVNESKANLKRKATDKISKMMQGGSGYKLLSLKRRAQSRRVGAARWIVRRKRTKSTKRLRTRKGKKSRKRQKKRLRSAKVKRRSGREKSKIKDIFE